MGDKTGIQWTDATWNPVTGCSKVSQGCKNCYAERVFARAYGKTRKFTDVATHPDRLDQPLRWRRARRVFVNSMSDLFHEDVPFEFIAQVFTVMAKAEQHTFQVLTKRPARMLAFIKEWGQINPYDHWSRVLFGAPIPLPNVWLGVSCEDQETADERVALLMRTPAAVRFVSAEPLIGRIVFESFEDEWWDPPARLDWVIVGGESGPCARPFDVEWARNIIGQCKDAGVACFVKQLGARPLSDSMFDFPVQWAPDMDHPIGLQLTDRKGGDMAEWPEDLRVREFPCA